MLNSNFEMTEGVLALIEELELGGVVRYILENNPSQALSYHSFSHSLWVAYYAHHCYSGQKKDCLSGANYEDTPKELIIAALFHDFGHSGGFFADDTRNIFLASDGFANACVSRVIPEGVHQSVVHDLISGTKYPFDESAEEYTRKYVAGTDYCSSGVVSEEQFCFMLQCLRDADLMQNCNDTLLSNFVGIKSGLFKRDDYREYTQKHIDFLKTVKYQTPQGKAEQVEIENAVELLEQFQKLVFTKKGEN